MTGDLTPDSTGDYLPHIIHNGKISYRRTDGAYFIWWDGGVTWFFTPELGNIDPPRWQRVGVDIEGTYNPIVPATGIATVTEI